MRRIEMLGLAGVAAGIDNARESLTQTESLYL